MRMGRTGTVPGRGPEGAGAPRGTGLNVLKQRKEAYCAGACGAGENAM